MTSNTDKSVALARFHVSNWMACGVGLERREDWIGWSRGLEKNPIEPSNDGAIEAASGLPTMLRRRISIIGQMAFRAGYALGENHDARFIFCSRHGEFQRTLRILSSLVAGEPVSPAEFSLSVHNALAGLLSIAWKNSAGHTTIAAGADSFGSALIDAVAGLKSTPAQPVILVYFDDLLPEPYDELGDDDEACFALALLLGPPHGDDQDLALDLAPRDRRALSATGQARDFLRFMLSGERERTTPGERLEWRWHRGA